MQVKVKESLTSFIRSKNIQGDIFNLIQYINDYDLVQAKYWACNVLNYDIDFNKYIPKIDWNSKLHSIQKKRKKNYDSIYNKILPDFFMYQYSQIPSYEWWQEGIKCKTQKEFEIALDDTNNSEKIVFPVRDENSKLLTVKARFTHEFENQHKDMKYFYLYPYNRQLNLFNLNKAKPYISDCVYVFEGEKSCMLAWQWGIKNTVSTQGKEISPMQIRKLIELNCKIIFVFDKDVPLSHFNNYKNQLKTRLSYCIVDTDDIFLNKDSPVDKGREYFLNLINNPTNKFKI